MNFNLNIIDWFKMFAAKNLAPSKDAGLVVLNFLSSSLKLVQNDRIKKTLTSKRNEVNLVT
jgi:hypothetical protein